MDPELVSAAKETAKQILAGEYKCQKGGAYAAQALAFNVLRHDTELRRRAIHAAQVEGGAFVEASLLSEFDAPYAHFTDDELVALQEQALRWREQE